MGLHIQIPKSLRVLIKTPRDCTVVPVTGFVAMNSPVGWVLRYPIQMPNRKRSRAKKSTSNGQVNSLVKAVKQLSVKPKKAKPFRDTGGIIGNRIGGMFGNASIGRGVGRWLGTGIGSIFGSGDYTLSGSAPAYNVMTNGSQIPKFSTTRQTNIVCHREYLGDITGTAAFTNRSYPLNPGMDVTFPWLSSLAGNYQEYKFHGLVFEFRSLITDFVTSGSPGVVVMSTNYNADAPVYTTKQQMENAEFAVATKPTINLMHGVECADQQTILPQRYVRNGDVPSGQDLRLYDTGNFQFATSANPVQDLGELWVSYCVEFFKPILPTVSPVAGIGHRFSRTGAASATPFGSVSLFDRGGLDVDITATTITINRGEPGVHYKIDYFWTGNAATWTETAYSFTNCTRLSYYNAYGNTQSTNPQSGLLLVTNVAISHTIVSTMDTTSALTVSLAAGGSYPGGTAGIDVWVTQVDPAI